MYPALAGAAFALFVEQVGREVQSELPSTGIGGTVE
jgi:hypothetical protein